MSPKKKNLKKKAAEFAYTKPALGKRLSELQKGFREVASLLEDKKK